MWVPSVQERADLDAVGLRLADITKDMVLLMARRNAK